MPDSVNYALLHAGKNRIELQKVIDHYRAQQDKRKLSAAYYIIGHLPEQYHYQGEMVSQFDLAFDLMDSIIKHRPAVQYSETWDSIQPRSQEKLSKTYDIFHVSSHFLIENIESSFRAWEYPWARHLTFNQFCEYLLPYKLRNEKPELWKSYFQEKYKWVVDSLSGLNDPRKACILINQEMSDWFYITKLNSPFDLSFSQILKLRSGRCAESTQMVAYAMRAMGIPVTLERVPHWANRNSGHDWNGLIEDGKTIAFLGTEFDPGEYKIEFPMPGSLRSKRAKIFRRKFGLQPNSLSTSYLDLSAIPKSFQDCQMQDVTSEYVPVAEANIIIPDSLEGHRTAYLCVFNSLKWEPVFYAEIMKDGTAKFRDMGTDIVYLPAVYHLGRVIPAGYPFILHNNGSKNFIIEDHSALIDLKIQRKYPVKEDNEIELGETYELFYWHQGWVSLGVQSATTSILNYSEVPRGALFWVHKINKGIEERIFTYEKGEQIWW